MSSPPVMLVSTRPEPGAGEAVYASSVRAKALETNLRQP